MLETLPPPDIKTLRSDMQPPMHHDGLISVVPLGETIEPVDSLTRAQIPGNVALGSMIELTYVPTLLGNDEKNSLISRSERGAFGYGNASERLQRLKTMSFRTFKESIQRMNIFFRSEGTDDAEGAYGFTNQGRYVGGVDKPPHIYPDADDVEEVLEYAFNAAKNADDIQDSAFILANGFVAGHPFNDGNGRGSRAIYSELSAGIVPGSEAHDAITSSTPREVGQNEFNGAKVISVGANVMSRDPQLVSILNDTIYKRDDVERYTAPLTGLNTEKNQDGSFSTAPSEALEGLDPKRVLWLQDIYDVARNISIDRRQVGTAEANTEPFRFALSFARERFPGIVGRFETVDENNTRSFNVERMLKEGGKDVVSALADGAREYYKRLALSTIDMMGGSEVSKKQIEHPGGGKITVKDRLIELSNNLISENIVYGSDHSIQRNDTSLEDLLLDKSPTARSNNLPARIANTPASRMPIVLTDFRGDPRRVPGHPSNPLSNLR